VSASTTAVRGVRFDTDRDLLRDVLAVYRPDCRYLLDAEVTTNEAGNAKATCRFSIPAPFYIEDTGHFNAVEFNLCYNQMMYYAVAKSVRENIMTPFAEWAEDDYRSRQLADFLIVDFHSSFPRGVRSAEFWGEIDFVTVRERPSGPNWAAVIMAETTVRYWDAHGGRCTGEVRLAVTNPPQVGAGRTT